VKVLYHHRTLGDGAEGIHIEEMVKAFRHLGHEVKVVALIGEKTNAENAKISVFSRIKRLVPKILYEFIEIGYNLYGYYLVRKEISKERPDFIYDRYITFNASAVLIGEKYKIPVILEVNAPLALERSQQEDERLYLKKAAFFFEKWICSNTYKTIVVSTPLKDYLVSLGVPSEKIVVMPNGVNVKKFRPRAAKDEKLLQKCNFDDHNVIVGFVGILRPWHGVDFLLEAFKILEKHNKNIRLLIVGDGPIRRDIEDRINSLGLSRKVFITGRVPHHGVADYIGLFDIAISPKATFYASPMKILEYMALGKAVIAPDMMNIRDIIDHKVNGILFQDGNYLSLANSISMLAENREYGERLGRNARHKTIDERNWESNAIAVCKLIKNGCVQDVRG
jgi:glycosyltransferase involved in cell wall biosynthesis